MQEISALAEATEYIRDTHSVPHMSITSRCLAFINSTSQYEPLAEDTFFWTIDKLNAGKRRSISFTAKAEDDGFSLSNASIIAISSDDGREVASSQAIVPVMVGKTVYSITPTAWQDWCPCDENLLGKLSWNETSAKSGDDLGCVCDIY